MGSICLHKFHSIFCRSTSEVQNRFSVKVFPLMLKKLEGKGIQSLTPRLPWAEQKQRLQWQATTGLFTNIKKTFPKRQIQKHFQILSINFPGEETITKTFLLKWNTSPWNHTNKRIFYWIRIAKKNFGLSSIRREVTEMDIFSFYPNFNGQLRKYRILLLTSKFLATLAK